MRMNRKTLLSSAVVACAFSGIVWKYAWATPGQGAVPFIISGPVLMDDIDTKSRTDTHDVKIKTKGLSDTYLVHFTFEPGGHTGWHSHPGPVFVMITAGALTLYQADDPDNPAVYPAGTGFVEHAGRVHIARNEGDVALELDAFFLLPEGAPLRIDEPAPN